MCFANWYGMVDVIASYVLGIQTKTRLESSIITRCNPISFMIWFCRPLGFLPVLTPDVVRESTLERCGFQPKGPVFLFLFRPLFPSSDAHV